MMAVMVYTPGPTGTPSFVVWSQVYRKTRFSPGGNVTRSIAKVKNFPADQRQISLVSRVTMKSKRWLERYVMATGPVVMLVLVRLMRTGSPCAYVSLFTMKVCRRPSCTTETWFKPVTGGAGGGPGGTGGRGGTAGGVGGVGGARTGGGVGTATTGLVGTNNTWPTTMRSGLGMRFTDASVSTVVPNLAAISARVSPGCTMYGRKPAGTEMTGGWAGVGAGAGAGGGGAAVTGICSTCPTKITSGLVMSLALTIAATVVPNLCAMSERVSPGWTIYVITKVPSRRRMPSTGVGRSCAGPARFGGRHFLTTCYSACEAVLPSLLAARCMAQPRERYWVETRPGTS